MTKNKFKLLVVEDEPDICTSIVSYFGKRGFAVSTTGSGLEALSMIKASKPDLVLLDISLNELSGVQVLKELRQYDQNTKVIIITGQMYPQDEVQKIMNLGVSKYLNKPLVLDNVAKVIYEILGERPVEESIPGKKEKVTPAAKSSGIVHKLSNLLGIIRNKCENFTSNVDEGIYKNKTADELVKMSVEIMKDIEKTVDKSMDVINQIKEPKKKSH